MGEREFSEWYKTRLNNFAISLSNTVNQITCNRDIAHFNGSVKPFKTLIMPHIEDKV